MKHLDFLFLVLIFLGICLVGCLAWIPLDSSISHFIIEDMFYYLQAARNLLDGRGASLDGIHPTNGFHPLWMLICCGVEWIAGGNQVLAVHLALSLCAAAFIGSGILLYLSLRHTTGKMLALPFCALYLANYRMMSIALGGLESSLNGFCIALLVFFLTRRTGPLQTQRIASLQRGERTQRAVSASRLAVWMAFLSCASARSLHSILLGLLLGLVYLSRMDAFLLGGIVLMSLWLLPDGSWEPSWISFRDTIIAGVVSVVVTIPWFVFSWYTSGVLLPNSRVAIQAWTGHTWDLNLGMLENVKMVIKDRLGGLIEPFNDLANVFGILPFAMPIGGTGRYIGALVWVMGVLGLVWILWRSWRESGGNPHLVWIPVYALAHTAYYVCFGRVGIRYLFPVFIPMVVFTAACLGSAGKGSSRNALTTMRRGAPSAHRITRILLVLILISGIAGADAWRKGYASDRWHPLHLGLYQDLAPWLRENTPPEARIGAFNAGILSYFSSRPVTNLDGVMNDSAIPHLQNKTLATYLDSEGIDYLADLKAEIDKFMGGYSGDPEWKHKWQVLFSVEYPYGGGLGTAELVVMGRK